MSAKLPDIRDQARGRWHAILTQLGVDEKALSGKHGPCPIAGCGGKDRWRWDNKDDSGSFFCTQCGAGSGINLVMLLRGLDFKDAAKLVREMLPSAPAVQRAKERTVEQKEASLKRMWDGAKPVKPGGIVAKYLEGRSIFTRSSNIREAVLPYYDDGKKAGTYTAMVARIATADGKGASLHVTYLTPDGKKAEVAAPKKVMQPVRSVMGAAVQLQPMAAEMGVAEGIETALAAYEQFDVPVWATISADGMAGFVLPQGVERLVIFADHDKNYAGHKAAYTLAFRAAAKGLMVEVKVPPLLGTDWNDVLIQSRQNEQRAA